MPLSQSELYKEINRIDWLIYGQQIEDDIRNPPPAGSIIQSNRYKTYCSRFLYCRSSSNLNKNLKNSNLFTIKATIKDRHGEILQTERSDNIDSNSSIRGLKRRITLLNFGRTCNFIYPSTMGISPKMFL